MWLVEYAKEVENYLDDSGRHILALLMQLGRLYMSDSGLPTQGELRNLGNGL